MASKDLALITGASSGIGATFARKLAAKGYSLILVARREERLAALAAELTRDYAITADILVADLANPTDVERVEACIDRLDDLTLLINNAGFGTTGKFANIDLARQLNMVQVHVIATMRFCRAALPGMIARGQGAIINVSSLAGFVPMPGNVTYCASKAFLISFSEALQIELAGTGVQVQALCPGFTYTEFHDTLESKGVRSYIPKMLWMPATEVVEGSLNTLDREQVICIPGFRNRLLAAVIHNTPAALRRRIFAKRYKSPAATTSSV